jgi:hemolysin activation/secretion protein
MSARSVAHGRQGFAACVALGLWALGVPVHAQTITAPPGVLETIDEGLRRQSERERAQQEALTPRADVLRPAVSGTRVPDLPDESPCFVIRDIALVGSDALRFRWLETAAAPFVNRCVGARGLALIAAYLDAQLIEQGYVTSRVSLGEQNLAQGRLEFRLDAGRIARMRLVHAGAAQHRDDERWGTWVNAFPTREGRLLNARDLEQGVEQMKRLPSQSVKTLLEPGATPGTSDVVIEREAGDFTDRLRGGLTLDNSGSPSLGRTQLSANLSLDNPLGLNDIASLSLNTNAEQPSAEHRSQSVGFNYIVPFGYSTFSLNASHSRFAQHVHLTTTQPLSSGESDSAELKWQHIAWRTASAKTGVYAGLSTRRARSFLDDTELTAQHRHTTFVETGLSFKQLYADGASVEMELGYRRGMPWLQAQDDLPAAAVDPGAVPTLRPHIWTLSASTAIPFKQPAIDGWPERTWQYSSTLKAQFSGDHTTSVDQIAIGNRNSVRGFDGDNVLLAESGWFLRNELSTPLQVGGVEASMYAGLDYGRVWGPSDVNLLGHNLAGAALGLRAKWKTLQFDLALATPLVMPEGFKTARTNLYASATCAF